MEKFWSALEEQYDLNEHPEWMERGEIIKMLFFSPNTHLGEIREHFDKWSAYSIENLAEYFQYREVDDDGNMETDHDFGERDRNGLDDYREAYILSTLPESYFSFFSRRKRFF